MPPQPPRPDPFHQSQLTPLLNEADLAARQRRFRNSRRLTGALVGLAMGLVFMAVSQNVNAYYLPDLPLYQPPPGQPWTVMLGGLAGALIGWITTWSDGSWIGILWGSLLGALLFDGYALLNSLSDRVPLSWIAATLLIFILPLTGMAAVGVGVLRWSLERQQAAWQDRRSVFIVAGIPFLLLLSAGGLGWTAKHPDYAQAVLTRTRDLIQTGQTAAQTDDLPGALASDAVENFIVNGQAAYTLEWDKDPNNRYAIPRPANSGGQESIAIARFENGWILICLFPTSTTQPECVSRWQAGR